MDIKAKLLNVIRQKTQIKLIFTSSLSESDTDFETLEGFNGFLLFQGKPIAKEIEEAVNNRHYGQDIEKKTYSQKQRGRILELWSIEHPKGDVTPEDYYKSIMEKNIEFLEKKLKTLRDEKA